MWLSNIFFVEIFERSIGFESKIFWFEFWFSDKDQKFNFWYDESRILLWSINFDISSSLIFVCFIIDSIEFGNLSTKILFPYYYY